MKYLFIYFLILIALSGCRVHSVRRQISDSVHFEDLNKFYKPLFRELKHEMKRNDCYVLLNRLGDDDCCRYVFYIDKDNYKAGKYCYEATADSIKISKTERLILNNLQYINIYEDYAKEPPLELPRGMFEISKVEGEKVYYWQFGSFVIDNVFYGDNTSVPMLLDTDSGSKSDLILIPFKTDVISKVRAKVKVLLMSPLSVQRQRPAVKSVKVENIDIQLLNESNSSLTLNNLSLLKQKISSWYWYQSYENMLDYHQYVNSDVMNFDLFFYIVPEDMGICL